jgi:hypothetical protein
MLTVLEDLGIMRYPDGRYIGHYAMCACDCGSEPKRANVHHLRYGSTKSCGCQVGKHGMHAKLPDGVASMRAIMSVYRHHAKRAGREFSLDESTFRSMTSSDCHYCGVPPSMLQKEPYGRNGSYRYNGIDRVDNALGYAIDNCVPSCRDCNLAKRTMSPEAFLALVTRIYQHSVVPDRYS